ncbi:MAG: carbamoyltransferase HypF [Oscillospiraceae bacterium]|nr:carbamoyltransferase HypF [Oscillospiraceae bacterium]
MQTIEVKIKGIVQGVGFRPFMHRLVRKHGLKGSIRNTSSGVTVELEGEKEALRRFLEELPLEAPPLAVIENISWQLIGYRGFTDFTIIGSERQAERDTLISPDIAICPDCLHELLDPSDRRYRYPFINCTNCGPRLTIIEDVPYDRPKTSMKRFPMCPDCNREYHDIENRRYHAQPDCCPVCGPALSWLDADGIQIPGDPIELAQQALIEGKIIAVKGLGGFHLACRSDDPAITRELRRRKQRDEKPFAVMCRNLEAADRFCRVSDEEANILNGARKPIVLLGKRPEMLSKLDHLSENGFLGVMLPYTPLHVLLFENCFDMLVMTSANLSDTPIIKDNETAVRDLQGIADGFLLHNRFIQTRCDDSLCWVLNGNEYFARRSRGYVPQPVTVPVLSCQILACGAEQKASFCLGKGEHAFLSQHIGDLKNLETLEHYENQIRYFERLFDIHPKLLVCDMHPDYLSTSYASGRTEKEKSRLLQVQHHHAHMAACMADNGLKEPCIGLIWDGTGLGTDNTIWGAECLVGGYSGFTRFGSIRPVQLIGGDRAVKEPARVAFSLLSDAGSDTSYIRSSDMLAMQKKAGINCPLSSGMGRLFDGVAAILGICDICSYEGQAAVLLEAAAEKDIEDGCSSLSKDGNELCTGTFTLAFTEEREDDHILHRFDWRPMIRELVKKRDEGVRAPVLAAMFMNTMIEMAVQTADAVASETGIRKIVLSGGCFQNMYVMKRLPERLRGNGFEVYCHRRVSCNDEGLSLGQLMIADAISSAGC